MLAHFQGTVGEDRKGEIEGGKGKEGVGRGREEREGEVLAWKAAHVREREIVQTESHARGGDIAAFDHHEEKERERE